MTEEFLVDVELRSKAGRVMNLRNHRIQFVDDYIEISRSGNEPPSVYRCQQFLNRPLKATSGKSEIQLQFNSSTEKEHKMLTFSFKPEHEQYSEWIINSFNEWIEKYKDKMQEIPKKGYSSKLGAFNTSSVSFVNKATEQRMKPFKLPPPLFTHNVKKVEPEAQESETEDFVFENFQHCERVPEPSTSSTSGLFSHTVCLSPPRRDFIKTDRITPSSRGTLNDRLSFDNSDREGTSESGLERRKPARRSPPPRSRSPSPKVYGTANRRLYNTGNSCYYNATMQALSVCPAFADRCEILYQLMRSSAENNIYEWQRDSKKLHDKFYVVKDLTQMITRLTACTVEYEDNEREFPKQFTARRLKDFRDAMGYVYKDFDNNRQQDSHDYYMALFGVVDDVVDASRKYYADYASKKKLASLRVNPMDAFKFTVETQYLCKGCQKIGISKDSRTDLSFHVREACSVQDLVNELPKWSKVEKTCDSCKGDTAYATDRISRFPQNLIVYLKLYEYDTKERTTKKKKFELLNSLEFDATIAQTFARAEDIETAEQPDEKPVETKIEPEIETEFEPKSEPKDEKIEKMEENGDMDNKENIQIEPMKLLGGNPNMVESAAKIHREAEYEIDEEPVYQYKFFSDCDEVDEILNELGIDTEQNYKYHLDDLRLIKEQELDLHNDVPFKTIDIMEDGNSFYKSISWCLTGCQDYHIELRLVTAKYLGENEKVFEKYYDSAENFKFFKSFQDFAENVETDGEGATSCEIKAMASMLNVRIFTFSEKTGWICHEQSSSPRAGSIYLSDSYNHFEPTVSLRKAEGFKDFSIKKRKSSDGGYCSNGSGYIDPGALRFGEIEEDRAGASDDGEQIEGSKVKDEVLMDEPPTFSQNSSDPVNYDLVSVICHLGDTPQCGHYVAYTKGVFPEDQWMFCSDADVYQVSKEEVELQMKETGYILFYNRS